MSLSESISFKSEHFDYQSELPSDYNAGNRFYGKDVADYLSSFLTEQGFESDYLDEDWGWLIISIQGVSPEFEIAIYNLAEHGEGGKPGIPEWGLWLKCFERKKLLRVFTKKAEVQVPAKLRSAVESAINSIGTKPEKWSQGPSDL